ncbi:MAG: CPBP family intramembrane metalloprotease [Deltaproteobacteria bacterium]|nr:MAG: CPBP family intramembrane metalloprotease [Deltaproteobacteria bacterium]
MKIKRNIIIFVIGTLILSGLGGVLLAGKNDIGGLVFIMGPILMMVILRTFGRDGWKNAGLKLNFRNNNQWYLVSIIVFPVTFFIVIILGILTGVTSIEVSSASFLQLFATGVVAQFLPRMFFALCEEFGWRGYLDPQLSLLKIADVKRHLIVGLIWAVWHFPLILSTDYTDIPLKFFLPVFTIGVMIAAIVYGQIRKYSQSVWPVVIMHGIGNTVAWAIVDKQLIVFKNKLFANISPESVFTIILWSFFSWWLLKYNKKLISQNE